MRMCLCLHKCRHIYTHKFTFTSEWYTLYLLQEKIGIYDNPSISSPDYTVKTNVTKFHFKTHQFILNLYLIFCYFYYTHT